MSFSYFFISHILETAEQKLEFCYDYIYNNTHKNRFALFENSQRNECRLYKDASKEPLGLVDLNQYEPKFAVLKPQKSNSQKIMPSLNLQNSVVLRVKNSLNYKLSAQMLKSSKSKFDLFVLPFKLAKIAKKYKNL